MDRKLVMSGSGTLFPIHVGVVKKLLECGCITEVCGTSGGALVGALVASGIGDLEDNVLDNIPLPAKSLDISFTNLRNYGLMSGDKIEEMFEKFFVKKFKDTKIPLRIVTANISQGKYNIFGTKETPDFPVAKAVRASISIPGIFTPVKINGDYHIDGGVINNFPLHLYGTGKDVVGVRVKSSFYGEKEIKNIKDYLAAIASTVMSTLSQHSIERAYEARTLNIHTKTTGLNFTITEAEAIRLIDLGHKSAEEWLAKKGELI